MLLFCCFFVIAHCICVLCFTVLFRFSVRWLVQLYCLSFIRGFVVCLTKRPAFPMQPPKAHSKRHISPLLHEEICTLSFKFSTKNDTRYFRQTLSINGSPSHCLFYDEWDNCYTKADVRVSFVFSCFFKRFKLFLKLMAVGTQRVKFGFVVGNTTGKSYDWSGLFLDIKNKQFIPFISLFWLL